MWRETWIVICYLLNPMNGMLSREDVHDNLSDHSSHANADDNSETWSEREEEQGQQCAVEEDSSEELEDDEDMYQRLLELDTDD